MTSVRIGSLPVGSYFRTCISNRLGMIIGLPSKRNDGGDNGIPCALDCPEDDKTIHPDIKVLPEE